MDANGYTAIRDDSFLFGEQYWVYHDNSLVGWVRYCCGVLAATHVTSKESMLPSPFLVHANFGSGPDDFFFTGQLRRRALRKCLSAIATYYGDAKPAISPVLAIMGPATPVSLSQPNLFEDLDKNGQL